LATVALPASQPIDPGCSSWAPGFRTLDSLGTPVGSGSRGNLSSRQLDFPRGHLHAHGRRIAFVFSADHVPICLGAWRQRRARGRRDPSWHTGVSTASGQVRSKPESVRSRTLGGPLILRSRRLSAWP
jgi:hypothetical protein